MRVLLDECLPRRLKQSLRGHDVSTVPEMKWAGKRNGELLDLAAGRFDVFVTSDQNLQYQQNLEHASIAVVVFECRTNRLQDLLPLVPKFLDLLQRNPRPGQVLRVGI
jgi:hypothetical protein